LYRVALNTALLKRRKDMARREETSNWRASSQLAEEPDSRSVEDVELLYACIHELPKVDRAIILLHLEHHTYEEMADITGLSSGNVSVRLVRAKEKLRKLLLAKGIREE
jgi:RNA polymerase sigma-70 factor (ECF subfamily)